MMDDGHHLYTSHRDVTGSASDTKRVVTSSVHSALARADKSMLSMGFMCSLDDPEHCDAESNNGLLLHYVWPTQSG